MKVRSAMTRDVIKFYPNDTIVKVLRTFSKKRISGAPVVDKSNKVIGIITDSDIIKKLDIKTPKVHFSTSPDFLLILAGLKSRKSAEEIKNEMKVVKKFKVKDFMKTDVITIGPEEDIMNATRLLNKHDITRMPVVDKKGKLVGIIARGNIINALAKM
ncbi:MAG: CBS domain-containing protein [Candidatus Aenigmarchaeota archaeon]|nr:CBS domain-containing protein [Candidatus Aenigmarchaeota archaeon]